MIKRILLAAFIALLVACSSGGATTTTAATISTTRATTTLAPETTTTAETTTTTAEAGTASEDCVLGDWTLDTESFELSMESVLFATGGEATVNVTAGGGNLSFSEDGTANGGYDDLTLSLEIGEDIPTMELVLSGDIAGVWVLEGDTLILTPGETSNFEVQASVGGQSVPVPIDPALLTFGSAASTITCDQDELFIEPQVEGANGTLWVRA